MSKRVVGPYHFFDIISTNREIISNIVTKASVFVSIPKALVILLDHISTNREVNLGVFSIESVEYSYIKYS